MSLQACANLVARADPERFSAVMAAPLGARAVLLPIYAAAAEVARAPWITKEPIIAEMPAVNLMITHTRFLAVFMELASL